MLGNDANGEANSWSSSSSVTLSEETFKELRAIIRDHAGIWFPDNKRYLVESRVEPRLTATGADSFEEYVRQLSGGAKRKEIERLVNAVTINETCFFRHRDQFETIANDLLPRISDRRDVRDGKLRLWSTACSAGDEAYSLAMAGRAWNQSRFRKATIEVVGTDIDTEALEHARQGCYRERAVRKVPEKYLERFFDHQDGKYVVRESIREMVRFCKVNLTDSFRVRQMGPFDIIVCANVLIYFADKVEQKVVKALYQTLRPGGYFLVGGPETLGDLDVTLDTVRDAGTLAYRKPSK